MKKVLRQHLLLTRTLLLATAGLAACHSGKHPEEEAVFPVTSPSRADTELTSDYVCQIHAIQHIEVRALERGYLEGIFVDEGQRVKKGQRLFQIMPTVYQAELEKARAEAEFAQIEFQNTKTLADRQVVSPQEQALAKAKLDKANAELALAQVHRGLTEIKAPFDGIIDRFRVRLGSLVDEGELLTTLSDTSKVWVYFNVTEAEYLDFKGRPEGEEAQAVRLLMANGKLFPETGRVETIEAEFNPETGTIPFRATFENPRGLLRHGQTGKILMSKTLKNALLIPQKATFEVLDKRYVFVVDGENTVHARQIAVSEELPQVFVVGSGLAEKDKILLEGLKKTRDGAKIASKYLEPHDVLSRLEVPAQ
jgi:membrane fusion protein (multidrug efflux system)